MKVSVTEADGLERRMTVEIPAEQIETEVEKRLKDAAKRVKIDGFRSGKAPMNVVRQRYGVGVRQEVLGELINKTYGEALQREEISPAGQPTIEPAEGGDTGEGCFSYTAVFEVYPEVTLAPFKKLKIEQTTASVSEEDVQEMIQSLRDQNAEWKEVDRACAEGDQVEVDFLGKLDGEPFEGGSAEKQNLELGSGRMIPGFEDGIVGMKAGEDKTIKVSFPEDYQAEHLAGKEAEFDIHLHAVKEKEQAELNDEFFAKFGVEEGGIDAFTAEVKKNMERELEGSLEQLNKSAVMEQLAEANELQVPSALVKDELQRLKQEMLQQYGQGQDIDLSNIPDDPFAENAEKRVRLGLLVSEVIKTSSLAADEDAVKAEISRIASTYEQSEEVENYYLQNKEMLQGVQMKVLEDQVVAHILEQAKVSDASKSYKEVMASRSAG